MPLSLLSRHSNAQETAACPNDNTWAAEEKFLAYIDEEIAASNAARAAIAAEDLDALFEAGDALYSPCENCHIDYNPAVSGEEF